jgi:hypothetical protein
VPAGSLLSGSTPRLETARAPRVEILYFEECPNYEQACVLVEEAATELGLEAMIELVNVQDADAAVRRRFLGSPTVRVDGRDVEPGAEERTQFTLACRVYRTEKGLARQPDVQWIRTALERPSST